MVTQQLHNCLSKNAQIPKYTKFHKGKKYMVTQQLHNCISKNIQIYKVSQRKRIQGNTT